MFARRTLHLLGIAGCTSQPRQCVRQAMDRAGAVLKIVERIHLCMFYDINTSCREQILVRICVCVFFCSRTIGEDFTLSEFAPKNICNSVKEDNNPKVAGFPSKDAV